MNNYIPADVRRELRQEANYGCVICGAPIIDYHHIVPRREREHNDPEHMVVLCPNHHRPSDDGALSRSDLYQYKRNPHNDQKVDYLLHFDSEKSRVRMGELDIVVGEGARHSVLKIEDKELFSMSFQDQILIFNIKLHNKKGDLIAEITNNEWKAHTDQIWDLEYKSKQLSLWDPDRQLRLRLTYDVRCDLIKFEAKFYFAGVEFNILPSKITASNGATVQGDGEIRYSGRRDGTLFYTDKKLDVILLSVY